MPARLCLIGFNYGQPFLFSRAINYLQETTGSSEYKSIGYGLIAATLLVYVGIAVCLNINPFFFRSYLISMKISTVHYQQRMYRTLTMFRGAMVSLIFSHSLTLSQKAHIGSAAVTHMSTGEHSK